MEAILTPSGPFSLAAAAAFGFGYVSASVFDGAVRLAFAVDGGQGYAGAAVRQAGAQLQIELELRDGAPSELAVAQVTRILSLDHDGEAFLKVGERDPRIAPLLEAHPGQRPVLFHSPYEAAAWGIISARLRTARQVRAAMAAELGEAFELAGQVLHAFPQPDRLAALEQFPGLPDVKVGRLRGLAAAAANGDLDVARIHALGPEPTYEEMQKIPGIGPFYAGLITLRASGFADARLLMPEPKVFGHAARLYELPRQPTLEEFTALTEPWRPFRTWTSVLIRLAGDRGTF